MLLPSSFFVRSVVPARTGRKFERARFPPRAFEESPTRRFSPGVGETGCVFALSFSLSRYFFSPSFSIFSFFVFSRRCHRISTSFFPSFLLQATRRLMNALFTCSSVLIESLCAACSKNESLVEKNLSYLCSYTSGRIVRPEWEITISIRPRELNAF